MKDQTPILHFRLRGSKPEDEFNTIVASLLSLPARDRGDFAHCLIHPNRESVGIGAFQPKDSQQWGSPEGQFRTIVYATCGQCRARYAAGDPETVRAIEAALFAGIQKHGPFQ